MHKHSSRQRQAPGPRSSGPPPGLWPADEAPVARNLPVRILDLRPDPNAEGPAAILSVVARSFLKDCSWSHASCVPIAGDASLRAYYRLRQRNQSAILMDASRNMDSVAPFIGIDRHLDTLGFSVPAILGLDAANGLMLLEDFGDRTFAKLLEAGTDPEAIYSAALDVLIALHKNPAAKPANLREYHPEKMLEDIELFLECRPQGIAESARAEFREAWREVLRMAHRVPATLLLRDYHVGNLMRLPRREGIRRTGLLDFQDAYCGPVAYDLVSLLEDARRDVPEDLKHKLLNRYLDEFPGLDRRVFEGAMAVLAAQRHTRVLAIFERLSRHAGKHEYKQLHSPRVSGLLKQAMSHPLLSRVERWMNRHACCSE